MLEPGSKAPDFSVADDQGNTHALADFAGKTLVLWFYPKADTPGWTAEGQGFRDLKSEFDSKNAMICGASFDTADENRAFAQKFEFNYPLLCDTDKQLSKAYGAADDDSAQYPARITVVVGPDGNVRKVFAGIKDKAAHPHEVLDSL